MKFESIIWKIKNLVVPPVVALLLAGANAAAETPTDLELFLLVGQSNMAGRGKVTPADQETHPRIFMLNQAEEWVPAKDPVHFDRPVAGVGLCSEFARCLATSKPKAKIGLVPCAVGGTPLAAWRPKGSLYNTAVARMQIAGKSGRLKAILWHQGESDSCDPKQIVTYPARFAAMIGELRHDLGAPDVPVIIGEIGSFWEHSPEFNAMLKQVAATVPGCVLVSAEGLTNNDKPDWRHFNADSLRVLGKRYFEAYMQINPKTQLP